MNRYLVGTDIGHVIHGVRFGSLESAPKSFTTNGFKAEVTCISFSPYKHNIFLVGFGDGTVSLYSTDASLPLNTWDTVYSQPILRIVWSTSRPSVFFAVSAACVYIWDLLQDTNVTLFQLLCVDISVETTQC
jgi:WD40 repeat protein